MKNTYIIFSLLIALFVGFGIFMAPSEASAYGSYYGYSRPYYYDIPSYSTDNPGYHGYRNGYYPQDNNYITSKTYRSYQTTYPKNTYNYNYNYNFYNAPVYTTDDVIYPSNNYRVNDNYRSSDYGYENNQGCYGYGC